jgi:hypothetical protein
MKQRKRIYYNAQQRAVIWDRYQQGDSLHDIAKIFDRMHSSIQGLIEDSSHQSNSYTKILICMRTLNETVKTYIYHRRKTCF